jgi:chromosome segregation ATPase
MSNETVTYSLESVFKEIKDSIKEVNQKIDTLQKEVNQKIDTLQKDVNQKIDSLETRMDERFDKVDERFDKVEDRLTKLEIGQAELKGELKGDIKVLDEKIEGLTARVGYQEFTNRGILIALVVAVLGGAAKLFGFFPNP